VKTGHAGSLTRKRRRVGRFVILPATALALAVLWVPIGQAFYYGFTDWNGSTAGWIGLANYRSFVDSPSFWQVLLNNVLLLTVLPIVVISPLALAMLVQRSGRLAGVFRTLLFLPVALSWVVIGTIAADIFATNGPVNVTLRSLGVGAPDWLQGGSTAMAVLLILIAWAMFGTNLIIYLGGLSSFDETLYDAARVDGATPLQLFFRIVMPLLSPFVRFVTVLSVTAMYGTLFAVIYVLTGGGPGFATTTLEFFVYTLGFNSGEFGAAAAAGVLLFIVIFLVNSPQLSRFLRALT
jgi:ABC-type sugar transport system permease subunit